MPKGYSINPKLTKDGFTKKQAKFIEQAPIVGPLEAAKIAYPDATPESQRVISIQNMANQDIVLSISKLAEEKGLTKSSCVETIKEGLSATKLYGKEGIEHADHAARLRAAEIGLKLHGELREDRTLLPIPVTKEQYGQLCREFWGSKPCSPGCE